MISQEHNKKVLLKVIRQLEDKLCFLKYCEDEGSKTLSDRESQIELLQRHLRCAHSALVELVEQEELEAA